MPADRNARRAIQRELGDLGQVLAYLARREPGRRMTGWWAVVEGEAVTGCMCIACETIRAGRDLAWLGPDRSDACYQARGAAIRHDRATREAIAA